MSRREHLSFHTRCLRHEYFGMTVRAEVGPPWNGVGLPLYCAECHKYLYPEGYPAKGDAGNDAPRQITHYDKEATWSTSTKQ